MGRLDRQWFGWASRCCVLVVVSLGRLLGSGMALAAESQPAKGSSAKPNIVWFIVDDMSANFSCYGERLIETPHVDQLAKEGTLFRNAFITAPVCSPCRSALITGMYQTSLGAHHHRSGRGEWKIHLPEGVTPLPVLFQQAGYYTCIGSGLEVTGNQPSAKRRAFGKTDYNFEHDLSMYDSSDWRDRKPEQPFFMQVQLAGGKLRGGTDASATRFAEQAAKEFGRAVDPQSVELPPYYPRDPVLLRDWAAYLDSVRMTDLHVGKVIERLKREGIYENTWIAFMTDHGISHARGKQFLYNEGTHVPLVIRGPGVAAGAIREDLVEHIDLAATSLAVAGIGLPASMQGEDLLGSSYHPKDAVFAARDRCDETVERIRSVRTDRYLYIRNYYPERPHLQPNAYKDGKSIVATLRRLHDAKELSALSEQLLFSPTRPAEELYAWREDPWQLTNLAGDPRYRSELEQHRSRLDRWVTETGDRGDESESMYDSDMQVYVGKGNPVVEKNIRLMKQWRAEGK